MVGPSSRTWLHTTLQSELNKNLQKKFIAIVNTGLTPYHANTILPFDITACAIPSESTSASAREKLSTIQRQDEYFGMKYTMNLGGHVLIGFNAVFGANSRGKYIFAKRLYKCTYLHPCLTTEKCGHWENICKLHIVCNCLMHKLLTLWFLQWSPINSCVNWD